MADVVFCQKQNFFDSDPFLRWARLIVYEDEYADCLDSASPFLFMFDLGQNLCIGNPKIPVGISETEDYSETRDEYEEHKEKIIKELLEVEKLNPQVLLYTTANRIKEAFYADWTKSMKLNCKVNEEKEIMYWGLCGKNDCALLVAFEDLSYYSEGKDYLDEYCDY